MELTNVQILNALRALKRIFEQEKELPILCAYNLIKVSKVLEDSGESIQTATNLLLQKYAKKNENNEPFINSEGNIEIMDKYKDKFATEYQTLLLETTEVNIAPIDISKMDGIRLSLNEMSDIEFLFV